MATLQFDTSSEAIVYLREADPVLARVIDAVGPYRLELRDDRFTALARAIVGQQLSVSAARTIWSRFLNLAGEINPHTVVALDEASMRAVGLSRAKATYVRDLASKVIDGTVELDCFDGIPDDAVIDELTAVKGIGRWTAEMFLIFSLGRLDVFAVDDAGLQRSLRLLLGANDTLDQMGMASRSESWRPYRSVASLYLWEALDTEFFASRVMQC